MSEELEIQWFPGHMTRAKREMEKSLKLVDLVAELCDARVPQSSRSPILRSLTKNKPSVLLLNKSDLADPKQTAGWLSYFHGKGIPALSLDVKSGAGVNRFLPLVKETLSDRIRSWEQKGMKGHPIRIMIVGIPNVGKSALINRLCAGKNIAKAEVRNQPGVTRQNRWFTLPGGVELLDTPGVLWHKFDDRRVGEKLAFTGAVGDAAIDTEDLAARLLSELRILYPENLSARYKLSEDLSAMSGFDLLTEIGKKRGMLISGGEVDLTRAATAVIEEFRSAKIGRISLERAPW